ncbi:MAG TPA: DUF1634 domain-containing protein [Thermoanaerobaculaceae bacterium]|nr:DUF1634 domain-containing protein [Thermoanaerobaculaceae bacterium]
MTDDPRVAASGHGTEQVVGLVLAIGVYGSVALMLLGALLATWQPHPAETPHGLVAILAGFFAGQGLALVQLGIALLIATPIMRVVASIVSFAHGRDWRFVVITLVVLGLLACSLLLPGVLGQGH